MVLRKRCSTAYIIFLSINSYDMSQKDHLLTHPKSTMKVTKLSVTEHNRKPCGFYTVLQKTPPSTETQQHS